MSESAGRGDDIEITPGDRRLRKDTVSNGDKDRSNDSPITPEHGGSDNPTSIPSHDADSPDITAVIRSFAASLTAENPYVCDPQVLSLNDAMAATQLTDPKMDCCEIPASIVTPWRFSESTEGTGHKAEHDEGKAAGLPDDAGEHDRPDRTLFPRPAPNGLFDEFTCLPWDALTYESVAWISLEMLVRFYSSLCGSSIGESTYTCLYVHPAVRMDMEQSFFGDDEPIDNVHGSIVERLRHLLMRSSLDGPTPHSGASSPELVPNEVRMSQLLLLTITAAFVETTLTCRGVIENGDVYEEEDYVVATSGINLLLSSTRKCSDGHNLVSMEVLVPAVLEVGDAMLLSSMSVADAHKSEATPMLWIMSILGFYHSFWNNCSLLVRSISSRLPCIRRLTFQFYLAIDVNRAN
jgi:Mak10 subunit, NatC N(alpha)-terminal acetyltransferase